MVFWVVALVACQRCSETMAHNQSTTRHNNSHHRYSHYRENLKFYGLKGVCFDILNMLRWKYGPQYGFGYLKKMPKYHPKRIYISQDKAEKFMI
jgi:uncharacterized C2H2 Zn-finger protein